MSKTVVHLRTTFVSQFAVVDEDGNTLSVHESDPMWTGALIEDEFVKVMQQLRALRKSMSTDINAADETAPATPPEPAAVEDTPCCGENR